MDPAGSYCFVPTGVDHACLDSCCLEFEERKGRQVGVRLSDADVLSRDVPAPGTAVATEKIARTAASRCSTCRPATVPATTPTCSRSSTGYRATACCGSTSSATSSRRTESPTRTTSRPATRSRTTRPDVKIIAYTHAWGGLSPEMFNFGVNASCETLADLAEALAAGWQAVIVDGPVRDRVAGRRVVRCLAERKDGTQCVSCGLCSVGKRTRPIISFTPHGNGRRKASAGTAARRVASLPAPERDSRTFTSG